MAKWKELPPSPEAIVRAALESAADEVPHWHSCDGGCVRNLASDPAEVAAILKKAGEDRV
jgi:hypothetical protein